MKKSLRILAAAVAPVPILATVVLTGTADASQPGMVAMRQSVNPAIATSARVGDLTASDQLTFAMALKPRDATGLRTFLKQVGDRKSALYHHFLTPAQYTATYGPTTDDVARVTGFLRANGLTVTQVSGNRQVVDAAGTAAQIAHAFHLTMGVYERNRHRFYANDSAPVLPPDVAGVVSGVIGLDNHAARHPSVRHAAVRPAAGPIGGMSPAQLGAAYDTGSLGTGAGVSVALWEFDGFQQSSVSTYDTNFGLGSSATTTVSVDGANFNAAPGIGETEAELDIELVQAIAPAARTFAYEAPNTDQGQVDMATRIATDDLVSVTSISWGGCESFSDPATIAATDAAFAQGVAEGISYYAASGDNAYDDCADGTIAVDYPASDPNVTGVGGTSLTTTPARSETAWPASGGGESTLFTTPAYQAASDDMRTVPDVAADADYNYAIFTKRSWVIAGGTSTSAPVWAGFTALHDAMAGTRLGNANPALYSIAAGPAYASAFHDITTGGNGAFDAGTGYDEVTGLGSYDGAGLHAALH